MRGNIPYRCLLELHYLPCIWYMRQFFLHDAVRIERHEHYQKRSYRNRSTILSPQGPQVLSVPLVKGKHQQQPVSEVRISYDMPWYAQHWHAIQTAYGSAPFFIHYGDRIRGVLYQKFDTLYTLNFAFLSWMLEQLHFAGTLDETTLYEKTSAGDTHDLRNAILPGTDIQTPPYTQVFSDRMPYIANLSALDLLMHLGPEASLYIKGKWDDQTAEY